MNNMFFLATSFNQDISIWNTSNVTSMAYMFYRAYDFNQNISTWNVSNVTNMSYMFFNATTFNQNLGNWNPFALTSAAGMFDGITLSTANYDALLNAWSGKTLLSGVTFSGGNSQYCAAGARATLIGTFGWLISDGGPAPICLSTTDFVTTWKTDNPGDSGPTSIKIPTNTIDFPGGYNYEVDWDNDGTFDDTGVTGDISHNYGVAGTYTVRIKGTFPSIFFANTTINDKDKIISVDQWGNIAWQSMYKSFEGASNLHILASDNPDLSAVTSMKEMFNFATSMNENINSWDVSNVTDMMNAFSEMNSYNQPMNSWDVSNVTSMELMFAETPNFNQSLSSWNTGNVTTMKSMFLDVTNFNGNISTWNTSQVTDMSSMFTGASNFNQNIGSWNTANVTNMSAMFVYAVSFNQNIGSWDTSNVVDFTGMFGGASTFNQNIGSWDTSSANSTAYMFASANAFNQNISSWNVGNVAYMQNMFDNATSFNQNLGNWNVANVTDATDMFKDVTLSIANYDGLLAGWRLEPLNLNVVFSAGNSQYCNLDARNGILSDFNWNISDGGLAPNCVVISTDSSSSITQSSALLNGSVVSSVYFPTTVGFQWGLDTSYGNTVTSATATTPFAALVSGVPCNTTYHYRAFGTSLSGNNYGNDLTFTTSACSVPPGPTPPGPTTPTTPTTPGTTPLTQPTTTESGIVPGVSPATPSNPTAEPSSPLVKVLRSLPRGLSTSIPYMLLLLLLILAILYAIQSYREYRSIQRFNILLNRYRNLQFGSRNFVALTNHYLGTPLGILQFSSELLVTAKLFSKETAQNVATAIQDIKDKVHELLTESGKATAQSMENINPKLANSTVNRSILNPSVWVPLLIAAALLIATDLLFIYSKVYQLNLASLAVQIGLFALCALLIILAFRSYVRNRFIRKQRSELLKSEQQLMDEKMNFVHKTTESLKSDINKLKLAGKDLPKNTQTKPFMRGLAMLVSVEKSFELMQEFSTISPFESISASETQGVVDEVINRHTEQIKAKNITVHKDITNDMNMGLSKSALIILLGSTINNAVKFSKDGGNVIVTAKNSIDGTKITISDDGVGIDKSKLDELMEPFNRATDAMKYDYEGIGLGLYLDRIIMEQIGGKISIASSPGHGTTIEMRIPRGRVLENPEPLKHINTEGSNVFTPKTA
jgi:surface protein